MSTQQIFIFSLNWFTKYHTGDTTCNLENLVNLFYQIQEKKKRKEKKKIWRQYREQITGLKRRR